MRRRLTVAECRQRLGDDAPDLDDAQLLEVRDRLYDLAAVVLKRGRSLEDTTTKAVLALSPSDRHDVEERAAIMQYDGGLTRDQAERLALGQHLQSKSRH